MVQMTSFDGSRIVILCIALEVENRFGIFQKNSI